MLWPFVSVNCGSAGVDFKEDVSPLLLLRRGVLNTDEEVDCLLSFSVVFTLDGISISESVIDLGVLGFSVGNH